MVERRYLAASSETMMTARQILATAPENLVPPARAGRFKLPQRSQPPKNTMAAEELVQRTFASEESIDKWLFTEVIQQILKEK
jgi:hypothetical protein